jgi:hypothetical protein
MDEFSFDLPVRAGAVSATDRKAELTLPSGPLLRRPVVVGSWLAEGAIGSAFLSSDSAVGPNSFSPSAYVPQVFGHGVNTTRRRKATDVRYCVGLVLCVAVGALQRTDHGIYHSLQNVQYLPSDCRGLIALTLSPNAMNLWEIPLWVVAIELEGSMKMARK